MHWILITLPGNFKAMHYGNLYAAYFGPILLKHGATHHRGATLDFTDTEHAFPTLAAARAAAKDVRALLTRFAKKYPSLLSQTDSSNSFISPRVTVMPAHYEKTGDRCLVRPDFHADGAPKIPTFAVKVTLPKKYAERSSPPLPAKDYCGLSMQGNDGKTYISRKIGNACRWVTRESART